MPESPAERPVRFVPLAQPPSRHDLLYWLVDAALCAALLDGTPDDALFAWDPNQPRDYRGRWSSGAGGGLSAADRGKGRADARAAVDAFLQATHPATDAEVKALAGHLARLTVAQLHELRRDHGLKGASALRKGELTDRLHQHVREAREKNRQEGLTGQAKETILPVESGKSEPKGSQTMTTQEMANGAVVESPLYRGSDETSSTITWRPETGPFAGQTLTRGYPADHPQAGRGVKFQKYGNEAAFKAAGIKANEAFVRVADRPDLAALAAEHDRRQAVRGEAARQKREKEQQADDALVADMKRQEAGFVARMPAGHVRVNVTEKGRDSDGDPVFEYEADGERLHWNTPGLTHLGTATAIRPGAMGAFAVRPVYSISRVDLEKARAGRQAKQRAAEEAARARREESEARRRDAFAEARRTGKPAVIRSWAESVDDPENENSLDIVAEVALPDGGTRIERSPTH